MEAKNRMLVAFDFDHTLIEDNSDLYVRKLAPDGKIPQDIKDKYSDRGWTEYMGAIFEYLHKNGVTQADILDCIREISFVAGMEQLLSYLQQHGHDVIIISDANSVFIECLLKTICCDHIKVYTNPAQFLSDGCLTLEYYHTQDWCDLSTVNLCKGSILDDHIKDQAQRGIRYKSVVYVGDGTNDYCPCLRLGPNDTAMPRTGYALEKKLKVAEKSHLKCDVQYWQTGTDILEYFTSLAN